MMRVETYSSFAYAVEPRAFEFENVTHRVTAIVRQWRTPGQIHFYVRDEQNDFFELTHAEPNDVWTIRAFGKHCPR
jgi:hypothetical protein